MILEDMKNVAIAGGLNSLEIVRLLLFNVIKQASHFSSSILI